MNENAMSRAFWGDLRRTEGLLEGAYRDFESPHYHSPAYGEAKGVAVAGTPGLGKVSDVEWLDDLAYGVQEAVVKYGGLGYQFVSEILKGEDDWFDKGQREAMEQYVGWREGRISARDLTDPEIVWEIAKRIDTDLFDKPVSEEDRGDKPKPMSRRHGQTDTPNSAPPQATETTKGHSGGLF